ncbi:Protein of unknown function [Propionibacterium freudenreichii]|nr:Protein of unknown function [Propionibacterium freudenreichii]
MLLMVRLSPEATNQDNQMVRARSEKSGRALTVLKCPP